MNLTKKFPLDKEMPEMLSSFHAQVKRNEATLKMFTKTVELNLNNRPKEAIFLAEKLKTLMNNDPLTVYLLAECYFADQNFVKVNYLF